MSTEGVCAGPSTWEQLDMELAALEGWTSVERTKEGLLIGKPPAMNKFKAVRRYSESPELCLMLFKDLITCGWVMHFASVPAEGAHVSFSCLLEHKDASTEASAVFDAGSFTHVLASLYKYVLTMYPDLAPRYLGVFENVFVQSEEASAYVH